MQLNGRTNSVALVVAAGYSCVQLCPSSQKKTRQSAAVLGPTLDERNLKMKIGCQTLYLLEEN